MPKLRMNEYKRIAVVGKGAVGRAIINGLTNEHGCRTKVYDSSNIETAYENYFDLVIYAGVKASKIMADSSPGQDLRHCKRAYDTLCKIKADRKILISTIDASDMFSNRSDYGKNRRTIERLILENAHHSNVQILRLPALYGSTVYKNSWCDAISGADNVQLTGMTASNVKQAKDARPECHFNILSTIRRDSMYAWYNLDDILSTLDNVLRSDAQLVQAVSYDSEHPNGFVIEHDELMRELGYAGVETLPIGANYVNYCNALTDDAARLMFERTDKSLFDPSWKEKFENDYNSL